MHWIADLRTNVHSVVELFIILMECIGMIVLVTSAIRCFIRWLRREGVVRLELARGIALALEFKLGGEVLRTVIVRNWSELGILGSIIVLRSLITFLLHWEIKNEEQALQSASPSAAGPRFRFTKEKKGAPPANEA